MKSISLEEFMKMLDEDNGSNGEEFIAKVLDKAEEVKAKEDEKLKKLKQNLHECINVIENEKDLEYFCWKMGMVVFDYFKKNVIGDDE